MTNGFITMTNAFITVMNGNWVRIAAGPGSVTMTNGEARRMAMRVAVRRSHVFPTGTPEEPVDPGPSLKTVALFPEHRAKHKQVETVMMGAVVATDRVAASLEDAIGAVDGLGAGDGCPGA